MNRILDEVFYPADLQFPDLAVCNIVTRRVFRFLQDEAAVVDLGGLANDQSARLATSGGWREVAAERAGALAAEGLWVVGTWLNPSGHGHSTLVRPAAVPVPWLMTCGEPGTAARAPWARSDAVHARCRTPPRFFARRRA
jgi:hypothetical protein